MSLQKLLKRDGYHQDQWKLPEAMALCKNCHKKRCWKCSQRKGRDAFPSQTIWLKAETSPDFLCSLCAQGPRQKGKWTCVAQRCRQQKDISEFSIAIQEAKNKGQDHVPKGSRRCDDCKRKFAEELKSQAQQTHAQVQQPSNA